MRRKNQHNRLQAIGEILYAALKRRGMAVKIDEKALFKFWPQAVGSQIALQTKPDSLNKGTLFVKTTSSVWVQQLHFVKEEIRQKMNKLAGKDVIKEIRFTVGHVPVPRQETAPEISPKKQYLKERDKKLIADCVENLADRELAVILKRIMTWEISRRRELEKKQAPGK